MYNIAYEHWRFLFWFVYVCFDWMNKTVNETKHHSIQSEYIWPVVNKSSFWVWLRSLSWLSPVSFPPFPPLLNSPFQNSESTTKSYSYTVRSVLILFVSRHLFLFSELCNEQLRLDVGNIFKSGSLFWLFLLILLFVYTHQNCSFRI